MVLRRGAAVQRANRLPSAWLVPPGIRKTRSAQAYVSQLQCCSLFGGRSRKSKLLLRATSAASTRRRFSSRCSFLNLHSPFRHSTLWFGIRQC